MVSNNYTVINSSQRDVYGNQLIVSDDVRVVKFYDASSEGWDKTGGGTASWFLETGLPNDGFDSGINADKWFVRGTLPASSICVDSSGARFFVDNSAGRIYLSSEGIWSLTGDFHIRLGFDPDSYYDEYRSEVSFGVNVSVGDLFNFRIARYRSYQDNQAFNGVFCTENASPTYFGWQPLYLCGMPTNYFDIMRVGDTIYGYVGDSLVAQVSGSGWLGGASVSIGSESPQINRFSMIASYFQVISGSILPQKTFVSTSRGPCARFPDRVLIVLDTEALSILDSDRTELWMRWPVGPAHFIKTPEAKVDAVGGRVFITSNNGLTILDFVDDCVYRYAGSSLAHSLFGLALRTPAPVYSNSQAVPALLSDDVRDINARLVADKEVLVLATASGINVVVDRLFGVYNTEGHPPVHIVHLSSTNNLYWACRDPNNAGELSYYTNIVPLLTYSGTSFSRTGFYDTATSPYTLTSTDIRAIHSSHELGEHVAVGSNAGFDVLYKPPHNGRFVSSFGLSMPVNPVQDPCFINTIGKSPWVPINSSVHPAALVSRSSEWTPGGGNALRLSVGNGGAGPILIDSFSGVSQTIDVSGVSKIYYDVRLVGHDSPLYFGSYIYEVLIGGLVVETYMDPGFGSSSTKLDEFIDVSDVEGQVVLSIRVRALSDNNTSWDNRTAYFTNFRVTPSTASSLILEGSSPEVLGVYIVFSDAEKKVVYQTSDGVGSVDLEDGSSDYFTRTVGFIPGMSINAVDIIDTDEFF